MSQTQDSAELYRCPTCGHHDPDLIERVTEMAEAGSVLAGKVHELRQERASLYVALRRARRAMREVADEAR